MNYNIQWPKVQRRHLWKWDNDITHTAYIECIFFQINHNMPKTEWNNIQWPMQSTKTTYVEVTQWHHIHCIHGVHLSDTGFRLAIQAIEKQYIVVTSPHHKGVCPSVWAREGGYSMIDCYRSYLETWQYSNKYLQTFLHYWRFSYIAKGPFECQGVVWLHVLVMCSPTLQTMHTLQQLLQYKQHAQHTHLTKQLYRSPCTLATIQMTGEERGATCVVGRLVEGGHTGRLVLFNCITCSVSCHRNWPWFMNQDEVKGKKISKYALTDVLYMDATCDAILFCWVIWHCGLYLKPHQRW